MRRPFLLSLIVLLLPVSQAAADKRVALVIGNSAYLNAARLANPVNDATAITEMFRGAAFDVVESRRDLTNADMRRALRDFTDKSRDADIAVIYYAGHGVEVDGTNYLIPIDAALGRDTDVYDEAIALDRILQAIEPARQLRLVILDACRDNPFAVTMKRTLASRSIGRGLAGVEPSRPNTLVAFAAKGGSTASDGDSNNSPFTVALLKHLTTPGLELRKAFGLVRDDVIKATGNKQEPFVYGSLGGNDVALVPAAPVAAATPAATINAEIRRDYELAERVGTREAWDFFIGVYPSGFYADLARAQRNKLGAETVRAAEKVQQPAETAVEAARVKDPSAAPPAVGKPEPDDAAADKAKSGKIVIRDSAAADQPPQIAALTPPAAAAVPAAAPENLNRLLQAELRRVGCQAGVITDGWNAASRRALEQFNKRAGLKLEVKLASINSLEAVRAQTARVCPLICQHGSRPDGDKCVEIVCKAGFAVGDDNICERIRPKAARRESPVVRSQRSAEPAPRPQASGQILCDTRGCRPVAKGCRIGNSPISANGAQNVQIEVCN